MKGFWAPERRDRGRGAALIEYVILLSLISAVVLFSVINFGWSVRDSACGANDEVARRTGAGAVCVDTAGENPPVTPGGQTDPGGPADPEDDEDDAGPMRLRVNGDSTASFTVLLRRADGPGTPDVLRSIDWGDGTPLLETMPAPTAAIITMADLGIELIEDGRFDFYNFSHTFSGPGPYIVEIDGTMDLFISNMPDNLTEVITFGDSRIDNLMMSFMNHRALERVAPIPLATRNVVMMLNGAQFPNPNVGGLSEWNVSNVELMGSLFQGSNIGADLSGWRPSSSVQMAGMFASTPFNGDISQWTVGA